MLKRRDFLKVAGAAAVGPLAPARAFGQAPGLVTAERVRPSLPSGVQAGDVSATRGIVWCRTDRPARMLVEYSSRESFAAPRRIAGPDALQETGFTARVELSDLAPGEPVFYRVRFESLAHSGAFSEPLTGSFRTAPSNRRDLQVMWSGDTVGQGWGINPDFGGLRIYEAMLRHRPDVFVHSGDMIYADNPLRPEVTLADGTTWKNLVTPEKAAVAQTLDEFRGNYAYNLLDTHLRGFNAAVPMLAQWDDHEVLNNWYPGMSISDQRYQEQRIAVLAARARQAMFEFVPFRSHPAEAQRIYRAVEYGPLLDVIVLDERSYRGPNTHNRQDARGPDTTMLGQEQLAWLKQRLRASTATWKVVASGMPLGLVVRDGTRDGRPAFEAWANDDGGLPLGRELEVAELLSFIKREGIRNVVWITADVHYAAAHHYDPARAAFTDFLPFWEFVAGPLHAGTFGPNGTDPTFGPKVMFHSVPEGMAPNRPPSDGLQFYGTLRMDGRTSVMTAALHDLSGRQLYSVDLDPGPP
jgi:alkaline phosphatase D